MQGTITTLDQVALENARDLRRLLLQIGPGIIAAAALAAGVGLWGLPSRLTAAFLSPPQPASAVAAVPAAAAIPVLRAPSVALAASTSLPAPAAEVASNPYGALVNPNPYGALIDRGYFLTAGPPVSATTSPTLQASVETASAPSEATISREEPAPQEAVPLPPSRDSEQAVETAPLPPHRPAEFSSAAAPLAPSRATAPSVVANPPAASPDNRNIFDKLFGAERPAGAVVASQPPQGRGSASPTLLAALFATSGPPAGYDRFTAVYDISARVVYMPDGTRLEAHSGLGDRLDDPRFVSERMRGATPPHLYELAPREASFHGVQALRLIPVGGGDLFGRAGLLAHSYMLGPNGDSNGCVSFKDYDAFLRAYESGQIKRLAVVARLS
jgi:hypothetical protein